MLNHVLLLNLFCLVIGASLLGACGENPSTSKDSSAGMQVENAPSNDEAPGIRRDTLNHGSVQLAVQTRFVEDTLDVTDYGEDIYSSPVIVEQELSFLDSGHLVKKYHLPIRVVKKKTIHHLTLDALQTPIYKICVSETKGGDYYIVKGSDFCNGSACPEFLGVYSTAGEVVYEGVSNEKQKVPLTAVIAKYGFDINTGQSCSEIASFH